MRCGSHILVRRIPQRGLLLRRGWMTWDEISQRDKIVTTLDQLTTSFWGFRCRAAEWLGVAPCVPVVSTGKHWLTHGIKKNECTLLFEPAPLSSF